MSIGSALLVAAVYAAYSGCFFVIDWLFYNGHPQVASVAAASALLVNWAATAVATSGSHGKVRDLLWLLFGAVVPFLGGAGLAVFGGSESHRSTGYALMLGTLVPVVAFLYIGSGYARGREPR